MNKVYKMFEFLEKKRNEKIPLELKITTNNISNEEFEKEIGNIKNDNRLHKIYESILASKNEDFFEILVETFSLDKGTNNNLLSEKFADSVVANNLWGMEKTGKLLRKLGVVVSYYYVESIFAYADETNANTYNSNETLLKVMSLPTLRLFYKLFPSYAFLDIIIKEIYNYKDLSDNKIDKNRDDVLYFLIKDTNTKTKTGKEAMYKALAEAAFFKNFPVFSALMDKRPFDGWLDYLQTSNSLNDGFPSFMEHTLNNFEFFEKMMNKYSFPKEILESFLKRIIEYKVNEKFIEIVRRKIEE